MNAEQLHTARLARWSQNGDARLTLESAAEWIETVGLCSFLPAGSTTTAPVPSFLEAVVGRPAHLPSAGERGRARELLARMAENASAVPLLFTGSVAGEQPEYLSSPEALRYIYALRAHRNPKTAPATTGKDKVSPLAEHCWQAIEQHGPLDISALQSILGGELTAAAVARALEELWLGLYCFPVIGASGSPAPWDLLARRFPSQLAAGAGTGQTEALSALVSLYLGAVVAATEDDVVRFLSPFAPQSKLRELLRALGSMRQLEILDIGGRAHVALEGGGFLPESLATLPQMLEGSGEELEIVAERGEEPRRSADISQPDRIRKWEPKKFAPKKFAARDASERSTARPRFDIAASGQRPGRPPARREDPAGQQRGPGDRRSGDRGPGERARRWEKSGERTGGGFGSKKSFPNRPADRPFQDRPAASDSGRPASSASRFQTPKRFDRDSRPGAEKPFPRKSFSRPGAGDAHRPKPWAAKGDRPQKPWEKRDATRPTAPRKRDEEEAPKRWESSGAERGERPRTERKPGGRPGAGKTSGAKFFGARPGGGKPWAKSAPSRGKSSGYAGRKTGENAAERKPWSTRSDRPAAEGRPPRQPATGRSGERSERGETSRPAGSPERKPFWAKNPRGGKGSTPAARTNRPRGGKPGSKSGGKKK